MNMGNFTGNDRSGDAHCELRVDNSPIGGATNRVFAWAGSENFTRSLSMFGGAQALAGGSEISLWCWSQFGTGPDGMANVGFEGVLDALIMAVSLGGFQ
jgi:hypothetical protein